MADNYLDSSSVSHNVFPLFPSIRTPDAANGSQKPTGKDDTNSVKPTLLEQEARALFCHGHENVVNSRANSGSLRAYTSAPAPLSHGYLTDFSVAGSQTVAGQGRKSEDNLEKTASDSSTKLSGSTSPDLPLDPRIIRAMGLTLAAGENFENFEQRGKFKYLSLYENTLKALDLNVSPTHSVFEVSKLDEFNQFLKLSELDQQIQEKLAEQNFSKHSNMLAVVDPDDFHKLYNPETVNAEKTDTKQRWQFPWKLRRCQKSQNNQKNQKNQKIQRNAASKSKAADTNNQAESQNSTQPSATNTPHRPYLRRQLDVRHLQMISMGGTLGVGLYLNVGKAFTIAGGLGTVLAMILVGLVVLGTLISFCEMVTFVSVVDGVSGLSSRFVDESFGFATGWVYYMSFAFGLAGEIVASVIILSYFSDTEILASAGATAGFVAMFLLICVACNSMSVRVFGEIEYFTSFTKVIITLVGIILMIVVNRGGIGNRGVIGFKYWLHLQSDFEHNLIFGPFRPSFNLFSDGQDSPSEGIGGHGGRFLSLLVACAVASYAYSGTEIVCIAACEAKDPRKALPSATNRVLWRILLFYCLALFVVLLNIYAGDPRLLRFYSGKSGVSPAEYSTNHAINYVGGAHCSQSNLSLSSLVNGSQSPWVVAFQSVGSCGWSSVMNAFLFFFAITCGNAHLYVASRTAYSLSLQRKAPAFLKKCNRFGAPYAAVLFAAAPGLLAFMCVSQKATTVFQNLTSLISSSGAFVWFAMCLTFVRFYFGLQRRPDIIGRNDKAYPYKSAFQPYSAILGLVGSSIILVSLGFVVFLKGCWNTWFFFSSYGVILVFVVLYVSHWMFRGTRIPSLEELDFDSGRREKDIYIWDGGKEYNVRSAKDVARKVVDWLA